MKRFLKRILGASIGVLALCSTWNIHADDISYFPIAPYGTLNNTDNSLIIPSEKAQDLLNVEIGPEGSSIKKRKGYAIAHSLTYSTSAVHGVHYFYDSSGNDVVLTFHDAVMSASVNGGAIANVFTNGPNGATWQCVDSQGFAYCANTSRSAVIKTNGVTSTNLTGFTSTGTLVAVTPERLAQAGFSANPNRIDFSKASDFTTWTTGANATDPINFTISAPGPKITHIVYAFDRLMWFKNSSFGYIQIGNQPAFSDWQVVTVDPTIGTLDNTSVYRQGILYFRGQDGHIYAYDGAGLKKLTRDIQGSISQSQARASNSWTQTSASDFNAGFIDVDIDSTTISGSLTSKTTYWISTSSSDWGAGTIISGTTFYADTTTANGYIQSTFPDLFSSYRNGSSGTKNVWTTYGSASDGAVTSDGSKLTINGTPANTYGIISSDRFAEYKQGTTYYFSVSAHGSSGSGSGDAYYIALTTANNESLPFNGSSYFRVRISTLNSPGRIAYTVASSADGTLGSNQTTDVTYPMSISLYIATNTYRVSVGSTSLAGSHSWTNTNPYLSVLIEGLNGTNLRLDSFSVAPATFTHASFPFNTGISTPIWSTFYDSSSGTGTITYSSLVGIDTNTFDTAVSVSSGSLITSNKKKYIKINSLFNQVLATATVTSLSLDHYFVTAGSSGTYRSAVKNAPSLTSWDTFAVNKIDNGGTQTFYIRSSTNPITVNSSTPSWTAINSGAIPSVSTGTYFQIRDDFYTSSSTQTQRLDDFTQNWFEGLAADKSYAIYFQDAIWWSVVAGTATSNNSRIFYYDMINDGMTLYDIPSNGFYVRNESLFFGSSNSGYIFKYGDVNSDNGSAINSYWKSKDYVIGAPFQDKEFTNISFAAQSVSNSSMTVTYSINGSSSTSYVMPLSSNNSFIKKNVNLPLGKIGQTFNIKFGNNASDQPYQVYGIQVGYRQKPWRPE